MIEDFTEQLAQFEPAGEGLLVRAPAKINLTLLVAGKRPDGFHELETIMAKISFYDEILIEKSGAGGVELVCRGPQWAPEGPENLVVRAAEALLTACGCYAGVRITLAKNIPAGSGLGSASSDAAATLLGLDRYLGLGVERRCLHQIAAGLGSDVAFFLVGPLAMCTGRGEKISPLNENFDFRAMLTLPDISVSTKRVYENYRHDGDLYESLSRAIKSHIEKNRIDLAARMCANMLGKSCFELEPELGEFKAELQSRGLSHVALSGSGSAMFCILERTNETGAESIAGHILHDRNWRCVVVANNGW